jgi:hypothetical protein
MPITKTAGVVQTLKTLAFNADGSMDSAFSVSVDGIAGDDLSLHMTAEETATIIDCPLPAGMETMRFGIIANLYKHLLTSGKLKGEVTE